MSIDPGENLPDADAAPPQTTPGLLQNLTSRFRQRKAFSVEQSTPAGGGPALSPIFQGIPEFSGGEAVLFDTAREEDSARMADTAHLRRLSLRATGAAFDPKALDRETALLLYVDDLATPRAKVRLTDLLRQGTRPLNLHRQAGQRVRLVLADPGGKLRDSLLDIEVFLEW
jgi:Ca-activated chloride channel family protein